MGLKKEDAKERIRTEWSTGRAVTLYIFTCASCGKDIRIPPYKLDTACGLCHLCSAKRSGVRNRLKPYEGLYNSVRRAAKNTERECLLTYEQFLKFTLQDKCHYCESEIKWAKYMPITNAARYNLDRVDNDLGYFEENLVVCCKDCNMKKSSTFTYFEFIEVAEILKKVRKPKKPLFIQTNWGPNENFRPDVWD